MKSLTTNYARGMMAEFFAMVFLWCKGYRIKAWRYKTPVGEVDIIAARGDVTAFIEVKLRHELDGALQSITPQMITRISRAAQYYVSHAGENAGNMRFDVVAVAGWRLRHLDNAWRPQP